MLDVFLAGHLSLVEYPSVFGVVIERIVVPRAHTNLSIGIELWYYEEPIIWIYRISFKSRNRS